MPGIIIAITNASVSLRFTLRGTGAGYAGVAIRRAIVHNGTSVCLDFPVADADVIPVIIQIKAEPMRVHTAPASRLRDSAMARHAVRAGASKLLPITPAHDAQ